MNEITDIVQRVLCYSNYIDNSLNRPWHTPLAGVPLQPFHKDRCVHILQIKNFGLTQASIIESCLQQLILALLRGLMKGSIGRRPRYF